MRRWWGEPAGWGLWKPKAERALRRWWWVCEVVGVGRTLRKRSLGTGPPNCGLLEAGTLFPHPASPVSSIGIHWLNFFESQEVVWVVGMGASWWRFKVRARGISEHKVVVAVSWRGDVFPWESQIREWRWWTGEAREKRVPFLSRKWGEVGAWDEAHFTGQVGKGEGTIIPLRQEGKKSFQTATVGNARVCQKGISWKRNLNLIAWNNTKAPAWKIALC